MKNIKCRNCFFYRNEWCEKIVDSPDPEEVRDCAYFREMTNADKIRAMSDEELAVFIEKIVPMNCDCCAYMRPCRLEYDEETVNYAEKYSCRDGIMQWLKQPAEEDDHA